MKSITIEKIPEGDAAREGARSHQRAGVAGGNVREQGVAGANARERGDYLDASICFTRLRRYASDTFSMSDLS